MQEIITRNYSKNSIIHIPNLKASNLFTDLPFAKKENVKMVKGHFPFGIHGEKLPNDVIYTTMLRNPVDRIISAYYYILERPNLPIHQKIVDGNLTISKFMTSGIKNVIENGQTKMIAGNIDIEYGTCHEMIYQKAIQNIESYFPVVGITEKFDESVLLISNSFDWNKTWYAKVNRTKNKVPKEKISPADIELIESYNKWDIKLYEYCLQRLNAQWEKQIELQLLLPNYRKKNKRIEKLRKLKRIFNRN
jgi:hypothetical protein